MPTVGSVNWPGQCFFLTHLYLSYLSKYVNHVSESRSPDFTARMRANCAIAYKLLIDEAEEYSSPQQRLLLLQAEILADLMHHHMVRLWQHPFLFSRFIAGIVYWYAPCWLIWYRPFSWRTFYRTCFFRDGCCLIALLYSGDAERCCAHSHSHTLQTDDKKKKRQCLPRHSATPACI